MGRIHYICEGTCRADISEERFNAGLVKCGAKGCTREGKPFTKCATHHPHTHPHFPHRSK